ncbi:hypothetical protein [Roseovarius aquimarinus]|uniref:Uncharacterized protein n=1 Tax=Roseovarius aquimarinus TaxID=1229156 RepID=A0ABW7IB75_9RHOB
MAKQFTLLNAQLEYAIEAERSLDCQDGTDPAVDIWLRDAEAAWSRVNITLAKVSTMPAEAAIDQVLVGVVKKAMALMATETVFDFFGAYDALRLGAFVRRIACKAHITAPVEAALETFEQHLESIAGLDLYQPICNPEDLSLLLAEA